MIYEGKKPERLGSEASSLKVARLNFFSLYSHFVLSLLKEGGGG